LTGGPPVRGSKLMAWRVPPIWNDLKAGKSAAPENSKVIARQRELVKTTESAVNAVFTDVQTGLRETVGVECSLVFNERCSIVLDLPEKTDTEQIARAIDLENIEAWRDETGRVNVGIGPWFSTKDVDQTVLSAVKVIHVLLGIHAADSNAPKTFGQKILQAVAEVINLQNKAR
jgi:hypothetical protein